MSSRICRVLPCLAICAALSACGSVKRPRDTSSAGGDSSLSMGGDGETTAGTGGGGALAGSGGSAAGGGGGDAEPAAGTGGDAGRPGCGGTLVAPEIRVLTQLQVDALRGITKVEGSL